MPKATKKSPAKRKQSGFVKLGIVGELLGFFWERRLWWLIPMIVVLVVFGSLMIFVQGSTIAPFVYALF